ncbi:G1/S-specific cyclin-E [Drosophila busckii]|uniref:G1/S-specific cyclin-E n=1 Tax=Drosophila busckii TaxID=30019 RepID=UPI001432B190|nr:G1/S-specific cyclin-E [Drosophila busckii]XP_033150763.1 G1/S-specific cyclin-E [Drosophila busckii]
MDLYANSANTASSSSSNTNNESNTPASINNTSSSSSSNINNTAAAHSSNSTTAAAAAETKFEDFVATSLYQSMRSAVGPACEVATSWGNSAAHNNYPNLGKRKRSTSSSTKDPELGFEPPSAKRQQRVPTAQAYGSDQSNQSSVASSDYNSPLTATSDVHELLSIRSSPAEELPEAPHSPLPDSPDSPPSPDRGVVKQQAVVVRYAAEIKAVESDEHVDELDDSSEDYSFDEEEELDDDDEEEEINSSSVSPASSTATGCSQNGERTPATQHQQQQQHQQLQHQQLPPTSSKLRKLQADLDYTLTNSYECMSPAVEHTVRQCPLPALSWANAADVWRRMCERDTQAASMRSSSMLEQHPGLQPRMRAILLDWLIEVCEVYKLHRETYYLAFDYLDRYLHVARKVQKTQLQLIGITCLFMAAKVEEIYPPKICEFAYVTDGACTEHDILQNEKLLLQALDWDICPITITGWLGIYMQLNVNNRSPDSFENKPSTSSSSSSSAAAVDDAFIYPQFSGYEFVQTSQLLDLCTLDVGMANYSYSVLAAAAISHTFSRETALRCSGLDWQVVQPCARWMEPFFQVISKTAPYLQSNEQNEQVTNKFGLAHVCPNIVTDDSHIIQTHSTTMDMYDELLMMQNALHAMRARTQASPATAKLLAPDNLLTPPASSHKPDDFLGDEEEVAASSVAVTQISSSSHHKQTIVSSSSSSSSSGGGTRT